MIVYILRRLGATLIVMAVVALFVFSLLFLTPGDPAAIIAGDVATADDIQRIRAKLGLNEPFLVQFGGWVGRLLNGLFSIRLEWLPVQGYRPFSDGLWPWLSHLILPSIALGTVYMAFIARITRAAMLDVLAQDYIRTANAKGLAPRAVLTRHALKNAGVPIITVIGIGIALLISGAIVTETVFAIPGIGRLTVDAILRRDYPIIQGVILLFSGVYVLINLLVDLSYRLFDPRIRY